MTITGFEQFATGQVFTSAPVPVNAEAIKAFGRAFDPQPQHVDEAAAAGSLFGTLVASGWHTAALTMRMLIDTAFAGISGRAMGVDVAGVKWLAPVKPGDALHATTEILAVRPSRSKPDRGLVTLRTTTYNAHDRPVQEITSTVIVLRSDATIPG